MIDRTSGWPEAVPLSTIIAESGARAFISTWISRFGVQALLTSNRDAQFTSSVFSEVCSVLGISHIQTTSYHPQSNGMIKRFYRSLKYALRARLAGSDWIHHLPLVMLGLRAAPKDVSGFSPAEAVYGFHISVFQGNSSNTQSLLQRFFSGKWRMISPGSLALHVIKGSLLLSFNQFLKLCCLQSLSL